MLLAALWTLQHVPTYTSDASQCLKPPRAHTTSQVAYFRAGPGTSSGIEIHCSSQSCPFDYANGEIVAWDATFKQTYDPSTYRLYVGCVGCMPEDPVSIAPEPVRYGAKKLEPFTGTGYHGLAGANKAYNTSLLDPSTCSDEHWGVRLVAFSNATTIYWGAVVGAGESFTAGELVSFTIFILSNHGATWNDMAWTLPVIATLVVLLDLALSATFWGFGRERWVPSIASHSNSVRSWLLQLASWSFLIAASEMLFHTLYVQFEAELDASLFVALFAVIGVAQILPWLLTVHIWRAHVYEQGCGSSPYWAPAQCSLGCGLLFLLGSGFLAGPIYLILDSGARLFELIPSEPVRRNEDELALSALQDL